MKLATKIMIISSALWLSACQAPPQPLLIVPNLQPTTQLPVQAFSVIDQRAHNYLLRIEYGTDQAQFSATEPALNTAINNALNDLFTTSSLASELVTVRLTEALIRVEQGAVKHVAQHQISLTLEVVDGNTTYSRDFNGKAEYESAFRADKAALERDFTALLNQVLRDVANDAKLRDMLTRP